jgi:hypothetical protein
MGDTKENSFCNGASRWALWFDNQSTAYDPKFRLGSHAGLCPNGCPLVGIPDSDITTAVTTGSAWVNASAADTTPHTVSSGAAISTSTASGSNATVELFPGASFVSDGGGLVNIRITSASLSCLSTVPSGGDPRTFSATGSYTGTVSYWSYNKNGPGSPGRVTKSISWSTSAGGSDPLASIPLTTVVYQDRPDPNATVRLTLADYISSCSAASSIVEEANNGLHQIPGVVNITTQPVRSDDATSSVGIQIGALSCAAADNR